MQRPFGPYPALAIVGGGGLAGLYGVDATPSPGTGLQHLFAGDYRADLVHTATTLLRLPDGRVEYGNRTCDFRRHPVHLRPMAVSNAGGYACGAAFDITGYPGLRRREVVRAVGDGHLCFTLTLENAGPVPVSLQAYAMVIFRPAAIRATRLPNCLQWERQEPDRRLAVAVHGGAPLGRLVEESPTEFCWRTERAAGAEVDLAEAVAGRLRLGALLGRSVTVPKGGSAEFTWHLLADPSQPALARAVAMDGAAADAAAGRYWEDWFAAGAALPALEPRLLHWYRTNLAALRAALMDGFVPADMSGQYFAGGSPSYYARDALMVARALLLSGHAPEAAAVARYLAARTARASGEFYQRYDAAGVPAEGQNNGVPHQLDSQGYFARLALTYRQRTGEELVPFAYVARCLDALGECVGPQGLVGPEGGVNEGVWGPAYIVSTNLCAVGGLLAGAELAAAAGDAAHAGAWRALAAGIRQGAEAAWDAANGRYSYGFVAYSGEPVRRYDTPQFFGPLYGCPLDARLRRGLRSLRRQAAFLSDGIGYGEQEYHHGPWIFNTAACAEYHALIGDWRQYGRKLRWLLGHSNGYGQMPEAVDADNPRQAFVDPLVWGCAEAVSALAILTTADGHRPGRLPGAEGPW